MLPPADDAVGSCDGAAGVGVLGGGIFESPFLLAAGRGDLGFSREECVSSRDYLSAGGFLVLDDTEASASSPFPARHGFWRAG